MFEICLVIGLILSLGLITVLAFRFEKRMVWPYGNLQDQPPYRDRTGYGRKRLTEAMEAGFQFLGWAPDRKTKTIRVSYVMLISPDQTSFVLIGVGTVLVTPVQGTMIFSATADKRVFYSADQQSCIELDLTKTWVSRLSTAKNFQRLWKEHREWLDGKGVECLLFPEGREIEAFQTLRDDRCCLMAGMGFITFSDSESTCYRYTLYAAMKVAFLNIAIGVLRGLSFGRFPRSA